MLAEADTVKFFARMAHLFGHKWITIYGSALDGQQLSSSAKHWRHDLRDYSRDQVAFGLHRVEQLRLEWPPGPLEFANLCDGIPTVAEVLDRDRDYGLVCRAIRGRMDWFNLDAMSSEKRRKAGTAQFETALTSLRRDGLIRGLSAQLVAEHKGQEALA